jgi:hypothetical protein
MSRFKVIQILALVLMLLAFAPFINADVPHLINYQGCLTDDAGQAVEDGEYQMQFRIHNDSTAYSPVWTSQPETILVINGLFNFQLGSKENIPAWIFENDTALWLGITVGSGPEPEEITPRTRLASAPYAFHAYNADHAEYADSAGIVISPTFPKVFTGAMNETTNAITGKVTIWFNPGHTEEYTSPPVVFVEVCDPYNGDSKHGTVTSTSLASFEVQVTETIGGSLFADESVDIKFIAIGENQSKEP